jgi:hypothetical protein
MTQEVFELSAENIRLKAQVIRKDQRIQEQADKINDMESESIDFARYLLWRPEQFKGQNVKDIYRKFKDIYEKNRESSMGLL